MKNFKFLLILFLISIAPWEITAQTGNTGVVLDVEVTPKCEDDGVTQTNFVSVYIWRVGNSAPRLFGNFDANGNPYTITDTLDVSIGYCTEDISVQIDTTYDYELIPQCDTDNDVSYYTLVLQKTVNSDGSVIVEKIDDYDLDGTPYIPGASVGGFCQQPVLDTLYDYNLVPMCDESNAVGYWALFVEKKVVADGSLIVAKVNDLDMDGNPYSPGISTSTGYCNYPVTRTDILVNRSEETATGSLSVTTELSDIVISNVGFESGTVTPSGQSAVELLPGEIFRCHSTFDHDQREMIYCPDINWDATGTTFHVMYRLTP